MKVLPRCCRSKAATVPSAKNRWSRRDKDCTGLANEPRAAEPQPKTARTNRPRRHEERREPKLSHLCPLKLAGSWKCFSPCRSFAVDDFKLRQERHVYRRSITTTVAFIFGSPHQRMPPNGSVFEYFVVLHRSRKCR